MKVEAAIVTNVHSAGAQAFQAALERAGFHVNQHTLETVPSEPTSSLFVNRALSPYDLPIRAWPNRWWNRPDKSHQAHSKEATATLAHKRNLPHPATILIETPHDILREKPATYAQECEQAEQIFAILGSPVVIKPDRGMQGRGVVKAHTVNELIQAMRSCARGVAQQYIPEASTTLRIICTRSSIVAAYSRISAAGDWRANVSTGATIEPVEISPADPVGKLAVNAMRTMDLDFAGIDIVTTTHGPIFLEANPSFGVKGLNQLFPNAVDDLVEKLLTEPRVCVCGETGPHDAWACHD